MKTTILYKRKYILNGKDYFTTWNNVSEDLFLRTVGNKIRIMTESSMV